MDIVRLSGIVTARGRDVNSRAGNLKTILQPREHTPTEMGPERGLVRPCGAPRTGYSRTNDAATMHCSRGDAETSTGLG